MLGLMHIFGLLNTFRGISRLSILYLRGTLPREVLVHGWDSYVLLKRSTACQSVLFICL